MRGREGESEKVGLGLGLGLNFNQKKLNVSRCRCSEGWLLLGNELKDRDTGYGRGRRQYDVL